MSLEYSDLRNIPERVESSGKTYQGMGGFVNHDCELAPVVNVNADLSVGKRNVFVLVVGSISGARKSDHALDV